MTSFESPQRIEPTRLEHPTEAISDLIAEISAITAALGKSLHPCTAAQLADLVRVMNTYYSNLIEGHNTKPKDIERALKGQLDSDHERRNLQIEARAHIRLQTKIDEMAKEGRLDDPTSTRFLKWLHQEFYKEASASMLVLHGPSGDRTMIPGELRSSADDDVTVGRHHPPSSHRVSDFMAYFESSFRQSQLGGKTSKIIAIAISHHRFNYIHPFPDGNGRVSRLMSHALAHTAGIGAHGLWSISRGLSRGLKSRTEYKSMMDHADSPRQSDLDGRGNLSQQALIEFIQWFLEVCLDQVNFMTELFELNDLSARLEQYVRRTPQFRPEAARLLQEALFRGEFQRGDISRITGLPERSARRVFKDILSAGLLDSDTPKGPVSLRFPAETLDQLFPRLFPQA